MAGCPRGRWTSSRARSTTSRQAVATITVPTLVLYGTDDGLAPPSGARMVGERIGAADVTVIPYAGLFHEILNEPERESVLTDIRGWLAERFAASVDSGARAGRGAGRRVRRGKQRVAAVVVDEQPAVGQVAGGLARAAEHGRLGQRLGLGRGRRQCRGLHDARVGRTTRARVEQMVRGPGV